MTESENVFGIDAFPITIGKKAWTKEEVEALDAGAFQALRTQWLHEQRQAQTRSVAATVHKPSEGAVRQAEDRMAASVADAKQRTAALMGITLGSAQAGSWQYRDKEQELVVEFKVLVPVYGTEAHVDAMERQLINALSHAVPQAMIQRRTYYVPPS